MTTALRIWMATVGVLGFAAVALGAWGAHGLKSVEADLAQRFDTALRFHFYHVLLLLALVAVAISGDSTALRVGRWAVLAGLVLFCGVLYASVLFGTSTRISPVGGVSLMIGWLTLVIHALLASR